MSRLTNHNKESHVKYKVIIWIINIINFYILFYKYTFIGIMSILKTSTFTNTAEQPMKKKKMASR